MKCRSTCFLSESSFEVEELRLSRKGTNRCNVVVVEAYVSLMVIRRELCHVESIRFVDE